jgi:hypothetical protein
MLKLEHFGTYDPEYYIPIVISLAQLSEISKILFDASILEKVIIAG